MTSHGPESGVNKEAVKFESAKAINTLGDFESKVVNVLRAKYQGDADFAGVDEAKLLLDNLETAQDIIKISNTAKTMIGPSLVDHDLKNYATVIEGWLTFLVNDVAVCDKEAFLPILNHWHRYRAAFEDIFLRAMDPENVPEKYNTGVDIEAVQQVFNFFSEKELGRIAQDISTYSELAKKNKNIVLPLASNLDALKNKLTNKFIEGNTSVVSNFLLNALRNALKDGIEAHNIDLSMKVIGDELVIRLEDDGTGLKFSQLDDRSEDFIFKSGVSATHSSGLGLTNADKRIASMGGIIYVVSHPKEPLVVPLLPTDVTTEEIDVRMQEITEPDLGIEKRVLYQHFTDSDYHRFASGGSEEKLKRIPFNNADHGTVFEIRLPIIEKQY